MLICVVGIGYDKDNENDSDDERKILLNHAFITNFL